MKQEDLVRPKLEAAQSKLETLAGVYPVILELAKSARAKQIWAEHEEAGDIDWCKHVIGGINKGEGRLRLALRRRGRAVGGGIVRNQHSPLFAIAIIALLQVAFESLW